MRLAGFKIPLSGLMNISIAQFMPAIDDETAGAGGTLWQNSANQAIWPAA
jgi:hypothetical protein